MRFGIRYFRLKPTNKSKISQIWYFGDLSDEITDVAVICEYTLRPVDICNFCLPRILLVCCHNHIVLGDRIYGDIFNKAITGAKLAERPR
jgi:hypothetical protein